MKPMRLNAKQYITKETEDLVAKELEALRQDEAVYKVISEDLKLTKKEAETFVGALLDYQEDLHYCASCPGLDRCAKNHPHFCLRLAKEAGVVARHYDPCEKALSLANFQRRFIRCSFPAEWRDENLGSIERSVSARNPAILAMAKAAAGSGQWIYLTGKAGSGKSFMLACLANQITKKSNLPGVFFDTGMLLNELKEKSIKDHEGFEELFQAMAKAPIVVFDDFGNEFKSEYVYTSLLFPLIAARDREGLLTAFSSDFDIRQIVSMYRAKIGPERADQLAEVLRRRCVKEYDVTGVNVH